MARKHREIGKAGWGYTAMTSVIGFIYFFPVLWIILTAFKTRTDAPVSYTHLTLPTICSV